MRFSSWLQAFASRCLPPRGRSVWTASANRQVVRSQGPVELLESRLLPAVSITANALTKEVLITGTTDADVATVDPVFNTTNLKVRVVTGGVTVESILPSADVAKVTFQADAGNDSLTNTTDKPVSMVGGEGLDTLIGGVGNDTFLGGAGNDSLNGGGGDDSALGGDGNDTLLGGSGKDSLLGELGNDSVDGGGFTGDTVSGGLGDDTINGGAGIDAITELITGNFVLTNGSATGLGNDTILGVEQGLLYGNEVGNLIDVTGFSFFSSLFGGGGDDTLLASDSGAYLFGGGGRDSLVGGIGNDRLLGQGSSFDTLRGGLGNDTLDGGTGTDVLIESGNVNIALTDTAMSGLGADKVLGIELFQFTGGAGNNTLNAASFSGSVTLRGEGGDDVLVGGLGNDSLVGGDGNDSLTGGLGNDILSAGAGNDLLLASGDVSFTLTNAQLIGLGTDNATGFEFASLTGGASDNVIDASAFSGPVTIDGAAGNDTLTATAFADLLLAGDGNDVLSAGDGNDTLTGGSGSDQLTAGLGSDLLRETADVSMTLTDASLIGIGNHTLSGFETAQLTDGAGSHLLDAVGFTGSVTLSGLSGQDTLRGGSAADLLLGGDGNDSLLGEGGDDVLTGQLGNDSLDGGAGVDQAVVAGDSNFTVTDTSIVSSETDTLTAIEIANVTGGNSANTINALAATLTLWATGGGGNDSILGGATNDILAGGDGADTLNGGGGNDTISGDAGDDSVLGGVGLDSLDGGDGNDNVQGLGSSGDTLRGGLGNDTLDGGTGTGDLISEIGDVNFTLSATQLIGLGTDTLLNLEGAILVGGAGPNAINASAFAQPTTLTGGGGNDTLTGGSAIDLLIESADVSFTLTDTGLTGLGVDSLSAIEQISLSGGSGNNLLDASGTSRTVTLNGGDGNDTLIGGSAADNLNGGNGNDHLTGNGGADVLLAGDGIDRLIESGNNNFTLGSGSLVGNVTDLISAFETAELTGGVGANLIVVTTFGGPVTLIGGDGNDTLEGTPFDDSLIGGAGDDTLKGEQGTDSLIGEAGADNLLGGDGNDFLSGGDGNDRLRGELGTDTLLVGNDTLDGGAGNDDIDGESGHDSITAGSDVDTVVGGAGNDLILSGDGNDLVYGGTGNDTIQGDAGNDDLRGDDGNDSVDAGIGADVVQGGEGNDLLNGGDGDDSIGGGTGNDSILAGAGNDNVNGQDGADTLRGEAGNDTMTGGIGSDSLIGDDGDDELNCNEGDDTARGGPGLDLLRGNEGNDSLAGDAGADAINGNDGADSIDGGSENDTVLGSTGSDTISGGDGDDELNGEADADSLIGGNGLDTLVGADGNDTLLGGAGVDSLVGDAGNDNLSGDDANDLLIGNEGNDTINGGAGLDTLLGMLGDDSLDGGGESDIVLGDLGEDTLLGGSGRDVVIGDHGSDSVNGGDGEDLVTGSSTKFDDDLTALAQLLTDWNAGTPYVDRVTQLEDENNPLNWTSLVQFTDVASLYDDYAQDTVSGGAGQDYFGRPGHPSLATTDQLLDRDAGTESLNVSTYGNEAAGYFPVNMTEPGYLQTLNDPTFGTPITRITDDPGEQFTLPINTGGNVTITWSAAVRTRYVTDSAWNIDGSKLMLRSYDPAMPYNLVLDGVTNLPLFVAQIPSTNYRWSQNPAKPLVQYGFPQLSPLGLDSFGVPNALAVLPSFGPDDDLIHEYNISTGQITRTIELPFNKLFSSKTSVAFRNGHEYVAMFGVDKNNPTAGITAYVIDLNAPNGQSPIVASLLMTGANTGTPEAGYSNALDFSALWFSPDGGHFVALYGGSTESLRSWRLLDVNYGAGTITPHVIPDLAGDSTFQTNGDRLKGHMPVNWSHPVFSFGPNGSDVYLVGVSGQFNKRTFAQNEITTSNGQVGSVLAFNVTNNTFHSLTDATDENLATHVTATNTLHPGYVFVTFWNDINLPGRGPKYAGELVAINLANPFGANGTIELAHHRTTIANDFYHGYTLPNVSPDGKKLVFSSTWGSIQAIVQTYVLDLTSKIP